MKSDEAFRAQFANETDAEEVVKKLRAAGYTFTFEEFQKTLQELAGGESAELSDASLAGVAGGFSFSDVGRVVLDVVKSVGDEPLPGIDISKGTDWIADKLAKGVKTVANVFK